MSSHDGTGSGEDVFYPTAVIDNNNYNVYGNVEMPHLLAGGQQQHHLHQQQQLGQQQQWWQPGQMLGQPFVQHPPPQQQQQQHQPLPHHTLHPQQQQQPQQAPYNEYFNFNMHAQYAAAAGPSETYSVLPVGPGNFLKVYHCPENANVAMPSDPASAAALYHRQQQQQQQQQHAFPPMAFQNMAHLQQNHHQQQQHQTHHQQQQQQSPASSPSMHDFNSYELFSSNTIIPTPESPPETTSAATLTPPQQQGSITSPTTTTTKQTTNMIINKLVNNWSPNLTGGTYSQFGGSTLATNPIESMPTNANFMMPPNVNELPSVGTQILDGLCRTDGSAVETISDDTMNTANSKNTTVEATLLATATTANAIKAHTIKDIAATTPKPSPVSPPSKVSTNEVKKRIVAEVKPMRMTYSDVLSKLNNQEQEQQQQQNLANSGGIGQQLTAGTKHQQPQQQLPQKNNPGKQLAGERSKENGFMRKQQTTAEESGRTAIITTATTTANAVKKSPTHESTKEFGQMKVNSNTNTNKSRNQQKQQNGKTANPTGTQNKPASAVDVNGQTKKRNSVTAKRGDASEKDVDGKNPKIDKDFNAVYNVTAATKHSDNPDKSTKIGGNQQSSSNSRSKQTKQGTNGSRSRYGNWNGNAGTATSSSSYSSKRSRHNNSSTATSTNRHYELAKKFFHAWYEYTVKILVWLYYLVYDIVVIGCSVAFERLLHCYATGVVYAKQWRKELKQNSNKPSLWLKDRWRRFDGRFHKNSKWAVWRRFYKKRNTAADSSSSTGSSKQSGGRLPQTGDEAMYSLLNCKGKDAYSILGVPPNSSQEQIRKHYKKIAVLVHPDKNKQAGAEEAFKVLQRAFELIGEPENRVAYDTSLAEALHAEKAWTELHDLLSQLQTKITEAANTIRCSTCGLRHPRKLTERPHYAARECASCKIRHSAREGDIWAETSLLGLRWKYLALMEGKVYDITEWANCQKGALSHLDPNSHVVQYRIVRGAQQQQQQHLQQHQQQQNLHQRYQQQPQQANHHQQQQQQQHHSPHHDGVGRSGGGGVKYKRDIPPSEASLHEFLDNLYSGQNPKANPSTANAFGQTGATTSSSSRRRSRRN